MEKFPHKDIKSSSEQVEQLNSFKEVVLKIRSFGQEAKRFKWWILLVTLLFSSYSFYQTRNLKTTYPATLTFILNEKKNDLAGGNSGFLLGFGRRAIELNFARIAKLSETKNIIQKVIFKKTEIGSKEDFIANHIIDTYKFHELWDKGNDSEKTKELSLDGFYFEHGDFSKFTSKEHLAFKRIQNLLVKIVEVSLDRKTNFLELEVMAATEDLSILLMDRFYEELSTFYIQDATAIPQSNLKNLQARADAISPDLKTAEQLINSYTRNKSYLTNNDFLQKSKVTKEKELLSAAYSEILKNKEKIQFQLQMQTPIFQIIDQDYSPIKRLSSFRIRLKALLLEGFLGGFFVLLLIVIRKSYLDAMAD